jgi:two-component system sensor histidine kinase GlrK
VRVTLYWKLLLGFGIVIALLAAADAYVLYQLIGVSLMTKSTVNGDVRSVDLSKQLRTSLYDEEREAQKLLVTGDTAYLHLFIDQQEVVESILDTLAHISSDESVYALVSTTEQRHSWYASAIIEARISRLAPEDLTQRQEVMMDTLDAIYQDIESLIRQKQEVVAASVEDAESSARLSAEVALLLTIGAILMAVAIAFGLTRTITKPLQELMRATDEVANGTFKRVRLATHGEMGRLASAFNSMGERLRKANEARAELMHHISHEIRMPLQTMHSAYYLLTHDQTDRVTEKQQKLLDMMRDNIDTIVRFSNQFLDLAKIEAGMMEYEILPVDLNAVLRPIVEEATVNSARKEISLVYDAAAVPQALANPDRCMQVFSNLLSNAVKYTNPGGTIRVNLAPSNYGVRVAVTDSGVGIAPEELPHVFKKFYRARTAGRRSGTGIGLALVRALMEAMRGKINVRSTLGKGSTFYVEFRKAQ